jgi:hypothetical protein
MTTFGVKTAMVAIAALATLVLSGNWRTAALAGLAAAAITTTRIRFAPQAATALLIAVAVLALDDRAVS